MTIYTILLWGSHPNNLNDDCWCGSEDLTTWEQVEEILANPFKYFNKDDVRSTQWFEIDGLPEGTDRYRRNRFYRSPCLSDDWRNEYAVQCGMAFGCDGYNDAMSY